MAQQNAVEIVTLRNEFYRDNYRRIIVALLFMVIVNVALVGIIFYQLTHRPPAQYFAASSDGKIVKLESLTQPVMGPAVIRQWAERAAVAVYTLNFVNYRQALQNAQDKFTSNGWDNYEGALRSSRMLETVLAKHLIVSAVATGAPVILDQGVVDGRYVWKVNLPLLVTYQSGTQQTQSPVVVTIIVGRVPTVNYPEGVAIESFVSQEGQSAPGIGG